MRPVAGANLDCKRTACRTNIIIIGCYPACCRRFSLETAGQIMALQPRARLHSMRPSKEERNMRELAQALDHDKIIEGTRKHHPIDWKFNPPQLPISQEFLKLWLKVPRSIKAILGKADIRDEKLHIAICGAERLLNSRPITYVLTLATCYHWRLTTFLLDEWEDNLPRKLSIKPKFTTVRSDGIANGFIQATI